MNALILFFIVLGAVFCLVGNLGVLTFPDVYSRLQASALASATSVISIFIACMLIAGLTPMTGKILIIALFFLVSSPVSTHIVARYAWKKEIVPWRKLDAELFPSARHPVKQEEQE